MRNVFAYTFGTSPRLRSPPRRIFDVTANYSGRAFVSVIALIKVRGEEGVSTVLIHLRTLMDSSHYDHQHLVLQSLTFKAVMMSLSYEHNLPDFYRATARAML